MQVLHKRLEPLTLSLNEGSRAAHFQIRTLTDAENIYSRVVMIYLTALRKVISKADSPPLSWKVCVSS